MTKREYLILLCRYEAAKASDDYSALMNAIKNLIDLYREEHDDVC